MKMGYIEQNLMEGERLISKTNLHWIVLFSQIFLALAISLLFIAFESWLFIAPLILTGVFYWYFRLAEFGITNRRIIANWGIITRHSVEMNLDKVEGVTINQGFMGRAMNYGTVILTGTGGSRETFPNIANPLAFRRQILEHTTKHLK
jgi:uncharacterized membrane protein YdbT with pleckstrin-like domain